ncbi:uncharacterized protein PHACADRAFT_134485 [Phanerochaete carnosa HHB-10118-sp]|uniref:Uncharacterized protein n=1 Tax=Phanerochaete carnosa (strain HHB-10118-sp) TaxID=650164 RepID=K5VDV6_PHACS|nr:uncharacterized protein PHACADRAFT_134485 [Phanerochaete carnosa HHB-10118-sp]EKM61176.1 hypothetical protein PHACADRAFT_134485 [Phanerochaete carnosa HHB-10118-sp]
MKPRDYCCCAIPTVYTGIYATLAEQFTLGVVAGTLSVATPQIVGAVTFSAAKWIFAIVCYVGAAIQVLGFIAVSQERSIMYRRYTTLHILITVAAFSVAAVWIALSAARHNTAKTNCESLFYNNTTEPSEANTLCDIFPWVDVGLMAGLWVLLAVAQLYFYVVVSSYGTGQRLDHEKYDSMYDPTYPLTSDIPLNNRGDPWDARPSDDIPRYQHGREDSFGSMEQITADKPYDPYGGPAYPSEAFAQEPNPASHVQDSYYNSYNAGGSMPRPETEQPHPGA